MKFETFKKELINKYEELNQTSIIKIDIPKDQEILKLFLSRAVFEEYEMKLE